MCSKCFKYAIKAHRKIISSFKKLGLQNLCLILSHNPLVYYKNSKNKEEQIKETKNEQGGIVEVG